MEREIELVISFPEKLIITGAGRAGTSFLTQLLTRLDCDTGMTPYQEPVYKDVRAGAEYPLDQIYALADNGDIQKFFQEAPWVLKAPDLSFWLKPLVFAGLVNIGHVIIPVRDSYEAALSRIQTGLTWKWTAHKKASGDFAAQVDCNDQALGKAVEVCVLADIPMTFMKFPLLVKDWEYCYEKIFEATKSFDVQLDREKFKEEFETLYDPNMSKGFSYRLEMELLRSPEGETGRKFMVYPLQQQ